MRCIVRDPFISLASVACTQEGICDGVAHTQVVILASRIGGSAGERIDGVCCARDETPRLADTRQTKKATHRRRSRLKSGTLRLCTDFGQDCWPTERKAKRSDNCQGMQWKLYRAYPYVRRVTSRSRNPSGRKASKEEQGCN